MTFSRLSKLSLKQYHWSCVLKDRLLKGRNAFQMEEVQYARKAEKHGACQRVVRSQVCP